MDCKPQRRTRTTRTDKLNIPPTVHQVEQCLRPEAWNYNLGRYRQTHIKIGKELSRVIKKNKRKSALEHLIREEPEFSNRTNSKTSNTLDLLLRENENDST